MNIMIMNLAFPKDKTKARALTKPQFDHVHDYIVECMNKRKAPKDAVIIDMLMKANMPINFDAIQCKHCRAEIVKTAQHWVSPNPEVFTDTEQYCWIDPVKGSQLHEPAL